MEYTVELLTTDLLSPMYEANTMYVSVNIKHN